MTAGRSLGEKAVPWIERRLDAGRCFVDDQNKKPAVRRCCSEET